MSAYHWSETETVTEMMVWNSSVTSCSQRYHNRSVCLNPHIVSGPEMPRADRCFRASLVCEGPRTFSWSRRCRLSPQTLPVIQRHIHLWTIHACIYVCFSKTMTVNPTDHNSRCSAFTQPENFSKFTTDWAGTPNYG